MRVDVGYQSLRPASWAICLCIVLWCLVSGCGLLVGLTEGKRVKRVEGVEARGAGKAIWDERSEGKMEESRDRLENVEVLEKCRQGGQMKMC